MIVIDSWLDAAVAAVEESAPALGFAGLVRGVRTPDAGADLFGAFVAMTSEVTCIQVGLLATARGHTALARTLLDLTEQEELGDADKIDAVRELTNVIAGGVKREMIGRDPGLRIGLPVFVHGALEKTGSRELLVQAFSFAGERVAVAVLQGAQRPAA